MHQQSPQNEKAATEMTQSIEAQPSEHKTDAAGVAESKCSDSRATIANAECTAIDLARVQVYILRNLELMIGHTIEQAISNATAPLLERIEAQTAQIEQLTAAQRAAQAAQAAAQTSYAEAQASLAGRIEAQAVAQRLLMDALQQLRRDHAPETAGAAILSAEVIQLKEATQRAVEEAFTKGVLPYLKRVREVSQEVHRVEGENKRLKTELETLQHQHRPWWKFWQK
jgi:hypothetical protein